MDIESTTPATRTAVLLIAHGSRLQAANDDLVQLGEMVGKRRPDDIVATAYLELVEPTIPDGARRCVELGADKVLMLPYFLSAGAHVSEDLARYCRQFTEEYPHVVFHVCAPLGLHPLMVEIVLDRLAEV